VNDCYLSPCIRTR